jgi:hypothetical protein
LVSASVVCRASAPVTVGGLLLLIPLQEAMHGVAGGCIDEYYRVFALCNNADSCLQGPEGGSRKPTMFSRTEAEALA